MTDARFTRRMDDGHPREQHFHALGEQWTRAHTAGKPLYVQDIQLTMLYRCEDGIAIPAPVERDGKRTGELMYVVRFLGFSYNTETGDPVYFATEPIIFRARELGALLGGAVEFTEHYGELDTFSKNATHVGEQAKDYLRFEEIVTEESKRWKGSEEC